MKIDTSSIRMDSERFYTNTSSSGTRSISGTPGTGTSTGRGNSLRAYTGTSFAASYMYFASYDGTGSPYNNNGVGDNGSQYDSFEQTGLEEPEYLGSDLYSSFYRGPMGITSVRSSIMTFHEKMIQQIEELMERIKAQLLGREYHGRNTDKQSSVLDLTTSGRQPGNLWVRQESYSSYSETETTTFSTVGKVTTADGRSIDFNMTLNMSRAFTQSISQISEGVPYILTDPLVLNLDDAPETISDQEWLFDLDGDGRMENISKLASGNAFLALDRDDNGTIDNGKELFGATTGNGFAELAEFDEDENGWIDENDSIYESLKVWKKDAAGNDVLTGLKDSDVGAIYLGAVNTAFSHKNMENNNTQAVVRQSGFFLHESNGSAGVMQQIDFASRKAAS